MGVANINNNLVQQKIANLGDTTEDKRTTLAWLIKQGMQKTVTGDIQINDVTDLLRVMNMDNEVVAQQALVQGTGGASLPTLKTTEADALGIKDFTEDEEPEGTEIDLSNASDEEVQNMVSKLMGVKNEENYDQI